MLEAWQRNCKDHDHPWNDQLRNVQPEPPTLRVSCGTNRGDSRSLPIPLRLSQSFPVAARQTSSLLHPIPREAFIEQSKRKASSAASGHRADPVHHLNLPILSFDSKHRHKHNGMEFQVMQHHASREAQAARLQKRLQLIGQDWCAKKVPSVS